ncbi:hypothetical protein AZE42_13698 [Rhizopogon vesiculosus]|uniref:Uncharacterized protein n=1 Tax=Rhizopogon vesiculosus TaxID=180088 RepID=A0A1J8Q9D7_9AGAM|nr:hypothetical protein AZE42_13698 [Rhizopogon vesiculosus]
MPWADESVRK